MPSRTPFTDSAAPASTQQESIRIAAMRTVHSAFLYQHNQEMEFRRWQRELAEVPAPPFGEAARSEWLRGRFSSLGLEDVHADEVGNVFGLLHQDPKQPLTAVSAHLDTAFPRGTRLETRAEDSRLYGAGSSDNAAGGRALLAMASALKRGRL